MTVLAVVIPHWSCTPEVDQDCGALVAQMLALGVAQVTVACGGPTATGGSSIAHNINRGVTQALFGGATHVLMLTNDLIWESGDPHALCTRGDVVSPSINGVVQPFFGAGFCAPKAVWESIGAFDPQFDGFYEDEDWALRCRRKHVPLISSEAVRFRHVGGASIGRLDATRIMEHGRQHFGLKWGIEAETLAEWMARGAPQFIPHEGRVDG